MRMIKVVPGFINRDFSMPATSFLRPTNTHKRAREAREMSIQNYNKRRRLEEQNAVIMEEDPNRDQPISSTEVTRQGSVAGRAVSRPVQNGERISRSRSGSSLVFVQNAQTGNKEFDDYIKEESPELGPAPPLAASPELAPAPPPENTGVFKKPLLPASKTARPLPTDNTTPVISEDEDTVMDMGSPPQNDTTPVISENDDAARNKGSSPSQVADPKTATIRESPMSSPDPTESSATQTSNNQQSTPRAESEAPFLHQSTKSSPRVTYGSRAKASLDAAQSARKAAQMLNDVRLQSNTAVTPQTSEKTKETRATRQTPSQRKTTSATKSKPLPPSQDSPELHGLRRTSTPVRKGKSTPARATRSSSNRITQQVNTVENGESTELPVSKSTIEDSTHTSPSTARSPTKKPRLSPKVVIRVRTPAAQAKPSPIAREVQDSPELIPRKPTTQEPTVQEPALDTQESIAPPKVKEHTKEQSTGPQRTPVPLPENVRHLANVQAPQRLESTPIKSSQSRKTGAKSTPKTLPKKQRANVAAVAGDATTPTSNGTGLSKSLKSSRLSNSVYDVPSSESPPPRSSAPRSIPRSQPNRTPVPLPMNVRHIYDTNTGSQGRDKSAEEPPVPRITSPTLTKSLTHTSVPSLEPGPRADKQLTPPSATSQGRDKSAEDPPVPQITSPTLNKILTRASVAGLESGLKADKNLTSPSAKKRAAAPLLLGNGHVDNGTVAPGGESSSTNSELEREIEKVQPKKAKAPDAKTKAAHKNIMKQMFPIGHEKMRKNQDHGLQVFGKRPTDPEREFELDLENEEDTLTTPNVDIEREASPIVSPEKNGGNAMDSTGSHESEEYLKQLLDSAANEQIMQEAASGIAAARASQSWNFDGVDPPNDDVDQADDQAASRPQVENPVALESGDTTENDEHIADDEVSKAVSPAQSTRSSPDYSRRPARYLSHSPTPGDSESDEESQASPSRAASSDSGKDATKSKDDDSTDSSSDSDTSSDKSDTEEDTDLPDGDKSAPSPSTNPKPSSAQPPAEPVTLVPATQSSLPQSLSQPTPTGTPRNAGAAANDAHVVPASQPTPSSVRGSSQSISQLAAARRAASSKYPSVKQQLHAAKTSTASSQLSKKFDPRTANFAKLGSSAAASKKKTFNVSDDSSEEESSSEDSSSEDDDGPAAKKAAAKKKGAGCSVA